MTPNSARPRLGELLVERRALLPHQLFHALDRQREAGARFGTCLLEEPGVDEAKVLAELARQQGVPAVSRDELRGAPRSALARVPGQLASRLVALPFAETPAGLAVAMRDPHDLAARDALAFASGRRIVPHIALELRIWEAIDFHYGEPAPDGYRRLWDRIHRQRHLWQGRDPADERPA
jgi:hypothetical protein